VKAIGYAAKLCQDEAHRAALLKHAHGSQSKGRIDAMSDLARKHPKLSISQTRLNADPWLLGLDNGVLDLKSGKFRFAVPGDFITQFSPLAYDPEAECPLFQKFVAEIMDDDSEMIDYMQKAAGYTLTGSVKEHCLMFLYGEGRNGKSLFIRIMQKLLGDYVIQLQPTVLMESHFASNGPTPELAKLPGKRMLCVPEVGQKHEMNQVLVKQLTGGDKISARALYKDVFEFDPNFKIWMTGNSKPIASAEDDAIWRRIHLIPFDRQFVGRHQDKDLESKLLEELPGICRWFPKPA
jgi:putative DNA primase/helicase